MQTVVTGQLKGEVLAKAHVYPTVRARAIASKAMKAIGEFSPGASVIYTETTTLARLVTTPVKMIKDKRATKATRTKERTVENFILKVCMKCERTGSRLDASFRN